MLSHQSVALIDIIFISSTVSADWWWPWMNHISVYRSVRCASSHVSLWLHSCISCESAEGGGGSECDVRHQHLLRNHFLSHSPSSCTAWKCPPSTKARLHAHAVWARAACMHWLPPYLKGHGRFFSVQKVRLSSFQPSVIWPRPSWSHWIHKRYKPKENNWKVIFVSHSDALDVFFRWNTPDRKQNYFF